MNEEKRRYALVMFIGTIETKKRSRRKKWKQHDNQRVNVVQKYTTHKCAIPKPANNNFYFSLFFHRALARSLAAHLLCAALNWAACMHIPLICPLCESFTYWKLCIVHTSSAALFAFVTDVSLFSNSEYVFFPSLSSIHPSDILV